MRDPDAPRVVRHTWVKVHEHRYVCTRCGTHKVNSQDEGGRWQATYLLPDGTEAIRRWVPACEAGSETPDLLALAARLAEE